MLTQNYYFDVEDQHWVLFNSWGEVEPYMRVPYHSKDIVKIDQIYITHIYEMNPDGTERSIPLNRAIKPGCGCR